MLLQIRKFSRAELERVAILVRINRADVHVYSCVGNHFLGYITGFDTYFTMDEDCVCDRLQMEMSKEDPNFSYEFLNSAITVCFVPAVVIYVPR